MNRFLHRMVKRARCRGWLLAILAAELLLSVAGLAVAHGLPVAWDRLHAGRHPSPYDALKEHHRFSTRWAFTDRGHPIRIRSCNLPPPEEATIDVEDAWLREQALEGIVVRTGNPGPYSNCFGWAFTGGRYAVDEDIDVILEHNGYEEVATPAPGDLLIYEMGEIIVHVGIVRGFDSNGEPVVESKWGARARYHHPIHAYPVPSAYHCIFYRSPRQGHQLKGVYE